MLRLHLVAIPLVVSLLTAAGWYLTLPARRASCEARGGHWILTGVPRCETDACFDDHSCHPHYSNTVICRQLAPGMTERALVFALGEPQERRGRLLFFTPSPDGFPIRAEMNGAGLLQNIDCNPRPP